MRGCAALAAQPLIRLFSDVSGAFGQAAFNTVYRQKRHPGTKRPIPQRNVRSSRLIRLRPTGNERSAYKRKAPDASIPFCGYRGFAHTLHRRAADAQYAPNAP